MMEDSRWVVKIMWEIYSAKIQGISLCPPYPGFLEPFNLICERQHL
jgi:hypothetical protein